MRTMDSLWRRCTSGEISRNNWDFEKRIIINGTIYTENDMFSFSVDRGVIFDDFAIGKATGADLSAVLLTEDKDKVKRRERVDFQVRITTLDYGDTPWYPFGVFYTNEAKTTKSETSIVAYDSMYKIENEELEESSMSCWDALNSIASYMEIEIDDSVYLERDITLEGVNKYTMRKVLGYIAGLNGGNFFISEENKLKLMKFEINDTPVAEINENNTVVLTSMPEIDIEKVVVKTSETVNKNSTEGRKKYTAGSGSNKFEVFNPWGDQQLAEDILYILQNYEFLPADYDSSEIDPAIEVGDTITAEGRPFQVLRITYPTRMYAYIKTPTNLEEFTQNIVVDGGGGQDDELRDILGIKGCYNLENESHSSDGDYRTFDNTLSGRKYGCLLLSDKVKKIQIEGAELRRQDAPRTLKIKGGSGLTTVYKLVTRGTYEEPNLGPQTYDLSELNIGHVDDWSEFFLFFEGDESNVIGLNNLDTSSLTKMNDLIFGSNFNCLNLNSWTLNSLENGRGIFRNAGVLSSIDLSSITPSKVSDLSLVFESCLQLETIKLPDYLNLKKTTTMQRAFYNCSSLESFSEKIKVNAPELTTLSEMFYNCLSLTELNLDSLVNLSKNKYDTKISLEAMTKNCSSLKSIKLPEIKNTESNLRDIFNGCSSLEQLDLSTIKSTSINLDFAFNNAESLKGIKFPKRELNKELEIFIDGAFNNTSSLEGDLDLTSFDRIRLSGFYITDPAYEFDSTTETFNNCGADRILVSSTLNEEDFAKLTSPIVNPQQIPVVTIYPQEENNNE